MDSIHGPSFWLGFGAGVVCTIIAIGLYLWLPGWWKRVSPILALGLVVIVVLILSQRCTLTCDFSGAPGPAAQTGPTATPGSRTPIANPTPTTPAGCAVLSGPGLYCREIP